MLRRPKSNQRYTKGIPRKNHVFPAAGDCLDVANSFKVIVSTGVFLKVPTLTREQLTAIGGAGIHSIRERVAASRNVRDQPAKPYSPRGPIYVPIAGRGTITRKLTSDVLGRGQIGNALSFDAAAKTITFKRTKGTLKGREVITAKDLTRIRKSGVTITKKGGRNKTAPAAGIVARDTGKSLRFANYSEYKKALGKSGLRDLELSGKMLNAIVIVKQTERSVTIGFSREGEHAKGRGNQAREEWFGLSPKDRAFILAQAQKLLPDVASRMKAG